ncbi:helix-turn-helix transcriptional regulator [Kordiimonas sp.]|uniref:helix-turn-helix transcriptional regulator n=1 Tax=Kordiimonas sp. TaxID=1970157 RepID=UPI003A8D8E5D
MKHFIRLPAIERKTGFKKSCLYDWIQRGLFPAPIKIGRSSVWDADDVDNWITDQISKHDQAA